MLKHFYRYYFNQYKLPRTFLSLLFSLSLLISYPVLVNAEEQIKSVYLVPEPLIEQNSINTIIQDSSGFLWLGTTDGLVRYDGTKTIVYKHDRKDTSSLCNNHIFSLAEDSKGQIWIGTNYGLAKLDTKKSSFTNYYYSFTDPKSWLSGNTIRCLKWDGGGYLWIGTDNGLDKYNPETATVEHFIQKKDGTGLSHNLILSLEINDANLWIGTDNGLNKLELESSKITQYLNDPQNPNSISNNVVMALLASKNKELWIGTDGGLNSLDFTNEDITRYQSNETELKELSNCRVRALFEDNQGLIWIGTSSGVRVYDKKIDTFLKVRQNGGNYFSVSSEQIRAIYEDRSGLIWIGTQYGGVYKHDYRFDIFDYYSANPENQSSLSHNIITCLSNTLDGKIWVGTHNGVTIIDPDVSTLSYINFVPNNPNGLSNPQIRAILPGKDPHKIWIGTAYGLNLYDITSGIFQHFNYVEGQQGCLSNSHITSLCIDDDGNVWVGTGFGLNKFNPNNNTFESFFYEPGNENSLDNSRIRSICNSQDGNLWISTNKGLNLLNVDTEEITRFVLPELTGSRLEINQIMINNSDIWLMTEEGIMLLDPASGNLISINLNDGLTSNNSIVATDESGEVWLLSNSGLYKYDGHIFNKQLGKAILTVDSINQTAATFSNGALYFGGLNGLIGFNPEKLEKNIAIAPIVITKFESGNETHLLLENTINLENENNSFNIEFALLDFLSPDLNTYSYLLEGYENQWKTLDTGQSKVSFTGLKGGHYIFKVKGANCDGVWSHEIATLNINIAKPFWQSWWFIVISIGFIISTVAGAISLRTRAILSQKKHLEKIVQNRTESLIEEVQKHSETSKSLAKVVEKQKITQNKLEKEMKQRFHFIRVLIHEIKTPLTSMHAATEILLSKAKEDENYTVTKTVLEGVRNIERRTNDLVDLTKGEIGLLKLKRSWVDIYQMLAELKEQFQYEITALGCDLKVECQENIAPVWIDYDRIWQTLFNLIENSLRHNSDPLVIHISAYQIDSNLIIKVEDDGKGFNCVDFSKLFNTYYDLSSENNNSDSLGLGLPLSKMIVENHGGQIHAFNNSSKGCCIKITLPYRQGT